MYEALDSTFERASVNAVSRALANTGSALEAVIVAWTSLFLFSLSRSSASSFGRGGALEEKGRVAADGASLACVTR